MYETYHAKYAIRCESFSLRIVSNIDPGAQYESRYAVTIECVSPFFVRLDSLKCPKSGAEYCNATKYPAMQKIAKIYGMMVFPKIWLYCAKANRLVMRRPAASPGFPLLPIVTGSAKKERPDIVIMARTEKLKWIGDS